MARFTSPDANGAPGPTGPTGPAGVGVPEGGNAGDILAKIDSTDFNTEWIENYTSTVKHMVKYVGNSTIPVGTPVYAVLNGNGNSSTNIPVNVASNASEATSSKTMGLVEASVAKNGFVYVVTEGLVEGIDTSTANTGDPVWLGVNGTYIFGLANKPTAPAHLVFLGVVTRGQQTNGEIFVKVQNGFELDELHTVSLEATASIADNEVLAFDSSSGLWKNQTAAEAGLAPSTSGSWTLAPGANTVSFTVDWNFTYSMWVRGNIPNGIAVWNAFVTVTNANVPVIGSQHAWYYTAGNALVLTAIPTQIVGTEGSISTASPSVGTTSNTFVFNITNNSGQAQTVYYGYTKV
jgi:hypothetical protein